MMNVNQFKTIVTVPVRPAPTIMYSYPCSPRPFNKCQTLSATASNAPPGLFDGTAEYATATTFSVACGCDGVADGDVAGDDVVGDDGGVADDDAIPIISPVFSSSSPAPAAIIASPGTGTQAPFPNVVVPITKDTPAPSVVVRDTGAAGDKDNTTTIVAGVVSAAAAAAAFIVIGAVCLRRRRRAAASIPRKPSLEPGPLRSVRSTARDSSGALPPPYGSSVSQPPESVSASDTAEGQREYVPRLAYRSNGPGNSSTDSSLPVTASTGNISTAERADLAQAFRGRDVESGAFAADDIPLQEGGRGGIELEVGRRRPSGGGVGVARAVLEAARDLAQSSPILGISEAATLVTIMVDLVANSRDSNSGGEERLKRCRSIVILLQRASKVLGKVRRRRPRCTGFIFFFRAAGTTYSVLVWGRGELAETCLQPLPAVRLRSRLVSVVPPCRC